MTRCRLYLITPPRLDDLDGFADTLEHALAAGDVAAVQVRIKGPIDPDTGASPPDPEGLRAAAERLTPVIQAAGAAAIINDDPDLAAAVEADGVHVGREDASVRAARAALGPSRTVGATCHDSRHLAIEAGEAGADYVAFGAFFDTTTKNPATRADPEILTWWSELFTPPCVAIGGVTPERCAPLVHAGADFLAVSSAVWSHPRGAAAGVTAMLEAINAAGDAAG